MSIDYSHLSRVVMEMEQGVNATTKYSWLDLARELIRIRGEMDELLEPIRQQVDDGRELVMWCPETMLNMLTKIRDGDDD
jgi:hypothetical protein